MNDFHYNVMFTTVPKQELVRDTLSRRLPSDRGVVFCPMMETYRRDKQSTVVVSPMYPGYVFIRSDLTARELHDLVRECRHELMTYVGELGARTQGEPEDMSISDLSDEETRLLDILLDFDKTGGEVDFGIVMDIFKNDPDAGVAAFVPRDKDTGMTVAETSTAGLLRMSYGYRVSATRKRWVVMEGPLRALSDHIVDVNTRDKKAYLDIKINDRILKAGLELKPRAHWFPDTEGMSDTLDDGTEIDLDELKYAMTRFRRKGREKKHSAGLRNRATSKKRR